eukprot:gene7976-16326_t
MNSTITTDKCSSTLDDIQESCETAVEILNELLLYEKLEKNDISIDLTLVSVKSFFEKRCNILTKQAKYKDIQFNLIFSNDLLLLSDHHHYHHHQQHNISTALISIDIEKFNLIIRTVGSNAIDYTSTRSSIDFIIEVAQANKTTTNPKSNKNKNNTYKINNANKYQNHNTLNKNHSSEYKLLIRVISEGIGGFEALEEVLQRRDSSLNFTAGVLNVNDGKRGLGLWIAHHLVKLHSGDLSMHYNNDDNKTITTIEIPVVFNTDDVEAVVEQAEHKSSSQIYCKSPTVASVTPIIAVTPVTSTSLRTQQHQQQHQHVINSCLTSTTSTSVRIIPNSTEDIVVGDEGVVAIIPLLPPPAAATASSSIENIILQENPMFANSNNTGASASSIKTPI